MHIYSFLEIIERREGAIPSVLKESDKCWMYIEQLLPYELEEESPELNECIRNILGTQILPSTPHGWYFTFCDEVRIFSQPSVPGSGLVLFRGDQIVEFTTDSEIFVLRHLILDILDLFECDEFREVLPYLRNDTSITLSEHPSEVGGSDFTISGDEGSISISENELFSLLNACNDYFKWGRHYAQVHGYSFNNLEG